MQTYFLSNTIEENELNIKESEDELETLFVEKLQESERIKNEHDDVMYELVKLRARCREHINNVISAVQTYIVKTYGDCDMGVLNILRTGLTMCPMSVPLYRQCDNKRSMQIYYNALLYEWKGRRIMYVRADHTAEGYYDDCDNYNGFMFRIEDRDWLTVPKYSWWSTEGKGYETEDANYDHECKIETIIKYNREHICTAIHTLPPEYWLIPIVFDLARGSLSLFRSDRTLPHISQFTYVKQLWYHTDLESESEADDDTSVSDA